MRGIRRVCLLLALLLTLACLRVPAKAASGISSEVYGFLPEAGFLGLVAPGTTEEAFFAALQGEGEFSLSSGVATGSVLTRSVDGQAQESWTLAVLADLNGDGVFSVSDMLMVKSLLLGLLTFDGAQKKAGDVNGDGAVTITDFLQMKSCLLGLSSLVPRPLEAKDELYITVSVSGEAVRMPLETYVALCVAAEMPASYPLEALKAQAVCARSVALYRIHTGVTHANGAAVCDNSGHCQAMRTEEKLRETWGRDYDKYWGIVTRAVEETKGQILMFEDSPAQVFYFSSANGMTENVEKVFTEKPRPYLVSVPSPEEPDLSTVTLTFDEFRENMKIKFDLEPTDEEIRAMEVVSRTESDRVISVRVAGVEVSGVAFRHGNGLRSTDFTWEIVDNTLVFTVYGFGHGVGMSQKGARAMALEGSTGTEILAHYYPGTTLGDCEAYLP